MNAASPWDALIRRSVVRRLPQPTAEAAESSKTQMLLDAIDQLRHVTTMRLCLETDLDSRAVWGLLKQHRKLGRVRFTFGEWSPGVSAASIKAQQAATLLRSQGWTVVEPSGTAQKGSRDD
jgi:hypothetical protein